MNVRRRSLSKDEIHKEAPPVISIRGISKQKNLRSQSYKTKTDEDNLESLFLSIAKDSFWTCSKSQVNEQLKNTNKFIRDFLEDKRGVECIQIYQKIQNRTLKIPVVRRATIMHELQLKGVDYYSWLYMKKIQNKDHLSLFKNLEWQRCIGSGAFSHVHLVENRVTKQWSVIKLQKSKNSQENLNTLQDSTDDDNIDHEVSILHAGKHPHILDIFANGILGGRTWVQLEFADEGTLADKIDAHISSSKFIPTQELFTCWSHIFSALTHLHELHIIHRDVKCENIFIFSSKDIIYKLGDFNLSRSFSQSNKYATTYCGTMSCMAPEIIGNDPYSYSADVWSALCVIISSTTFIKCNPVHIPTSTLCEKIKTHTDSTDIITLIEYLHKINHLERPSSKEALELILQLKEKPKNIETYHLLPEITPHLSPSNIKNKENIIIRTPFDEMSIRLPTRPASSGILYSKSTKI